MEEKPRGSKVVRYHSTAAVTHPEKIARPLSGSGAIADLVFIGSKEGTHSRADSAPPLQQRGVGAQHAAALAPGAIPGP